MKISIFIWDKKIVGKGENAGNHFLYLPWCSDGWVSDYANHN